MREHIAWGGQACSVPGLIIQIPLPQDLSTGCQMWVCAAPEFVESQTSSSAPTDTHVFIGQVSFQ